MLVECVPNVSEGRNASVVAALGRSIERVPGCCLLDVHSDIDHNRSVFTFAGTPDAVRAGVLALATDVMEMVDMRHHEGVHPRIGALDVVPVVPLAGMDMAGCVVLAREIGAALARAHHLPIYLYAEAAEPGRPDGLATFRRGGFEALASAATLPERPDYGPLTAHPSAGVTSVGARDPLLAFNLLLDSRELNVARRVAALVRESNNGLSGVQAIGLYLPSRDHAQVSMNLLDHRVTPLVALVEAVRRAAAALGAEVVEAELVGLAPEAALVGAAAVTLPGMPDRTRSIENRLSLCRR
ncbi:MAG: glutamate formimidoyltransferase [Candidatus Dormibacteria bacterium]